MMPSIKAFALAAGCAVALVTLSLCATFAGQTPRSDPETLVVEDATVDWIERSNVAALREGVIERMELKNGMPVLKGNPIGYLHSEIAELGVRKAEVAAKSEGPKLKAKAQQELAITVVAVNKRLVLKGKDLVSYEEQRKAEAEVKVATAMIQEAEEKILLDEAELALARRALEEHTIRAPFDGVVIERIKSPGESVRANEAVVQLGNLNKLRAYAYIPVDYAYRVKEGQLVDLQPRLTPNRSAQAAQTPIEQKRFRGKIVFVDPQIQPVAESAVRIYAEFDNKDHELRPGLKAVLTIYLNSEGGAAATTAVGTRPGLDR
jgi:RND family efflux transporter MFP subunit